MVHSTDIEDFLAQAKTVPVIDVRTPAEFEQGHLPGAFNLPLFSNEERAVVGTLYKQRGREDAIEKGLELTGPKLAEFVRRAKEIAPQKKLLVHCWRGGMRSGNMAWLLDMSGFRVATLNGGYKSFRRYVLSSFSKKLNMLVLGGMTGSGKTEVLHKLKDIGEQVIDLEQLAQHQGSAFGSMGTLIQPTQEQFENNLAMQLRLLDAEKMVWIEDESITIGKRVVPNDLWEQMREAMVIRMHLPVNLRTKLLVDGYSKLDPEFLKESILKIHRRLGEEATRKAIESLENKDYEEVVRITLHYYDKTYTTGLSKRNQDKIINVPLHSSDAKENAFLIRQLANNELSIELTAKRATS